MPPCVVTTPKTESGSCLCKTDTIRRNQLVLILTVFFKSTLIAHGNIGPKSPYLFRSTQRAKSASISSVHVVSS